MKYLGVLIDKNLSWKYHIDSIFTKISNNRVNVIFPREILINKNTQVFDASISLGNITLTLLLQKLVNILG